MCWVEADKKEWRVGYVWFGEVVSGQAYFLVEWIEEPITFTMGGMHVSSDCVLLTIDRPSETAIADIKKEDKPDLKVAAFTHSNIHFCCVVFVLIFVSARQHEVFMITGQGNWNDSLGREFVGRKIKVGNGYGIVKEFVDTKKMFLVFWPLSNSYSMTKIENEGPTITYLDAAYDIGEAKKKRVASASSTPVSSQKTSTPSKPLETLKKSETVMPSDKKKAVLEIPESAKKAKPKMVNLPMSEDDRKEKKSQPEKKPRWALQGRRERRYKVFYFCCFGLF